MPTSTYRDWMRAIKRKQRVAYNLEGGPREGCPHVLGLDRDGQEKILVCRVHPGRKGPAEWRCLFVSRTGQIAPVSGDWLEGDSHKQPNNCIVEVHIDVNRKAEQLFDWTKMRMRRGPAPVMAAGSRPKKKAAPAPRQQISSKKFWSQIARELSPYVPGEQPRIPDLVKLNTNETPFGPSEEVLKAMRAAASDSLRLYPDPEATELRQTLATHHGLKPEQIFLGNGSDEVLAHAFAALLKHPRPLLFPDVTYSFYPVWAQLFGISFQTVPLDEQMRVRIEDYRQRAGAIVLANPNAPTGIALSRKEVRRLLEDHSGIPVVIDEAYVDFGAQTAVPLCCSPLNTGHALHNLC